MDNLKTSTLSHIVVNSITTMVFNVPLTDNDMHDTTVEQIIGFSAKAGLKVQTLYQYVRTGFTYTFIQLSSDYVQSNGEVE